ncbi:MAG: malate dehydrogenase (oxaloacetate-decarboxylating)(NADP+) [Chloroflexi bacterium]|nr:MAG: malate dehydrogenase (oxaloacetate-decarboxylating)(NADP+) [Chloroflexota bacterium]MBA4376657.1 malate dehydrogenase [Anaerolinea sp.]
MPPITKESALAYHHLNNQPGKLSIIPSKPLETQEDLGLAYTPGVAYPVLEIAENADAVYEYTSKGNLVAVISNGTAILGLGDLGALASKPVMEGKSALFKKFADLDSIDIEVDSRDPDMFIQVVAAIAPTFGGINLEDIKSPECFFIEKNLQSMLDIPVFHDDQHGTAIILGAALLNSLEITGKKIDEIKIVFSGAGAAAIASASHMVKMGVPREHIWICDIKGLVYKGRIEAMFPEKEMFAQGEHPVSLADALEGADMLIGLSVANIVTPDMLKRMRQSPVIFAMANPDPEIGFDLARAARPDAIVGTGRSDFPNQVNNLLGFPYIFRGAMDVRAKAINDEMKIAASLALSALSREPVTREVLKAYNLNHLEFGKDYVVPKPFDSRICLWEAPAVAKAAMESGAARLKVSLDDYRDKLARRFIKA